MAFRDTLERVLAVGIASELDGVAQRSTAYPETQPPTGTAVDRTPGLNFFGTTKNGIAITGQNLTMLAFLGVAILGVIYLVRR